MLIAARRLFISNIAQMYIIFTTQTQPHETYQEKIFEGAQG